MQYKCLVCNRSTLTPTRGYKGNCSRCYEIHRKMVNSGLTTWKILEEAGQVLPPAPKKIPMYNQRRVE